MWVILLALGFAEAAGAEAPAGVSILQTGMFHGDEISVNHDRAWWALYEENGECYLKQVDVSVSPAEDPIVDQPGEMTGKDVSINPAIDPILLIQGLPDAQQGRVPTLYQGDRFYYPGETQGWSFEPHTRSLRDIYQIGALGTVIDSEYGPRITDYSLKLYLIDAHRHRTAQELARVDEIDPDGAPTLIWAGDLDRDGRLDLVMDLTNHYNVTHLALFLSSEADGDTLVARAAELRTTGC